MRYNQLYAHVSLLLSLPPRLRSSPLITAQPWAPCARRRPPAPARFAQAMCIRERSSLSLPHHPLPPRVHRSALWVCVSILVLQIGSSARLCWFHICALIRCICVSLSAFTFYSTDPFPYSLTLKVKNTRGLSVCSRLSGMWGCRANTRWVTKGCVLGKSATCKPVRVTHRLPFPTPSPLHTHSAAPASRAPRPCPSALPGKLALVCHWFKSSPIALPLQHCQHPQLKKRGKKRKGFAEILQFPPYISYSSSSDCSLRGAVFPSVKHFFMLAFISSEKIFYCSIVDLQYLY